MQRIARDRNARGKDRLIVALDVPRAKDAMALVEKLDNVSFFKVGLELWLSGELNQVLDELQNKALFVDLKVPGDIGNTIRSLVEVCVARANVKFLTLDSHIPPASIRVAKETRDKHGVSTPEFLMVPFLSNMDREDLGEMYGIEDLTTYMLRRCAAAMEAGCDGVVASGREIKVCRDALGPDRPIVSPAIRPAGFSSDDHKRFTTPAEAIELGADYLIVGRPIRQSGDPRQTAKNIIDEIDEALERKSAMQGNNLERAASGVDFSSGLSPAFSDF